ncbi:MAG TPA: hypothetical protein VGH80_04270 [Xanthomonadaceae bacterium]|jgi:hypothetical protein
MRNRLLDVNTWHGKGIRLAASAPKVAYVLVYFTGLFAIITVDSFVRRRKYRPAPKGSARI